jgi:hypothetical protein
LTGNLWLDSESLGETLLDADFIQLFQNDLSFEPRLNRTAILRLAAKSAIAEVNFLGLVNEALQTASKLGLYVRLFQF